MICDCRSSYVLNNPKAVCFVLFYLVTFSSDTCRMYFGKRFLQGMFCLCIKALGLRICSPSFPLSSTFIVIAISRGCIVKGLVLSQLVQRLTCSLLLLLEFVPLFSPKYVFAFLLFSSSGYGFGNVDAEDLFPAWSSMS